jgi:hypothetical protein
MENRASVRTPDFSTTNPFTWWSTLVQSMSAARLPGSGDLQNYQDIQTSLLRSAGDQLGFINVNTVSSADPELERDINRDVASYGRQLGWIIDALGVVIDGHLQKPSGDEQDAITQFDTLRKQIGAAKGPRGVAPAIVVTRWWPTSRNWPKTRSRNVDQLQRLRTALGPAAPA